MILGVFGMKKAYTKPTVEKVGSFESVTKSGTGNNSQDFNFSLVNDGTIPFTTNVFS